MTDPNEEGPVTRRADIDQRLSSFVTGWIGSVTLGALAYVVYATLCPT